MTDKNNNFTPEEGESTLFTAPTANETFTAKRKKNVLKRQRRIIVIFLIIIAILLGGFVSFNVYVGHVAKLYEEDKSIIDGETLAAWILKNIIRPEEEKELLELLPGEVRASNGAIMLFPHTERADIESIEVHNEHGDYTFYFDEEYNDFLIKDHMAAPYDKEKFSSLVVGTGYTITNERVADECDNFAEYGLDENADLPYYILTTREGEAHKVYIGDMISSGNGYYVRYADRDALYILNTDFSTTVLAPIESLVTPSLILPMNQNDYFTVKNFAIMKGDELQLVIDYVKSENTGEVGGQTSYVMLYPANYAVNTTNYSTALSTLLELSGTSTIVCSPTEENLEEYGLLEPEYGLRYEYMGIEQPLFFSEKNENGNRYVFSPTFNLIAEVDSAQLEFLEWDMLKWIDPPIFMMNIDLVKTMTIESETATRVFDLVGKKDELVVTERTTGFKPEVKNFRQFYKTILYVHNKGYVSEDLSEEELNALVSDEKNVGLTLTIETYAGKTLVYKFYPYSTRRAFCTVNGKGEFYVQRDMMTKIITDGEKVMTNTEIDAEAHS